MKKSFFTAIFAFFATMLFAQQFNEEYGNPLLVLIESNPQTKQAASLDPPTFALYPNGQIIYKKKIDNQVKFFELITNKDDAERILLSIFYKVDFKDEDYSVGNNSEQPRNIMFVNFDKVDEYQVYGDLRNSSEARNNAPKNFLKAFDRIIKFSNKKSVEWLPEKFEVVATECPMQSSNYVNWATAWGSLDDKNTIMRNDKTYSIFVDKRHFGDFFDFFQKLKDRQVEIDGKRFFVYYRFPFPNLY
ncbi:MAG: hypothetical protein LBN95_07185 [Prevotellaceae bacterium]|jgi:hypothetical protein|nr:hypothetical protein [Prevotellaceae bacterium]